MNELCRLTRLTNNIRLPARHSTCLGFAFSV